jgi:RNA recognition motif-containing protein
VEIVAKTNLKAKGQAFIVFDNVESATRAIDEVNGFELFDKPMVLDYAKTRSDATVLREGGTEELEVHKRRRLAEKGAFFDLLFSPCTIFCCLLVLGHVAANCVCPW